MINTKLLEVTNYFLENANNGILNIVKNSELLQENNFNDILTEENIKKVHYLYEVAVSDMESYLENCYKYLKDKLDDYEFIEDIYQIEIDTYYLDACITLRQIGPGRKKEINYQFYISFYYTKDDFMGDELNQPIITFELYLDSEEYDVEALRKINHPGKYKKMQECFDNIGNYEIYAYEKIDYNSVLTSEKVADNAVKFLEKYLDGKVEIIKENRYK